MEIIDAHQHFWQYHPVKDSWITEKMAILKKDYMPAEFATLLKENKVSGCVAVQASQSETETIFLESLAQHNPFIKGVVGWVDLRGSNLEAWLQIFSQYKIIKGFRHVVETEADPNFLLGTKFKNGISLLEKHNYTYDLLINPSQLKAATELVKIFPGQKFVVDHLAKPYISIRSIESWESDIRDIAQYPNVYCKVSGFGTEANWSKWDLNDIKPYLDVVFDAFGFNRVMYGSDWPVALLAGSYNKTVSLLQQYLKDVSQQDQQKFWAGNVIKFYDLAS